VILGTCVLKLIFPFWLNSPCVREVSEALRPSWKLAASMLPWFCKSRLEERVRGVPAGAKAPGPVPEMSSEERSFTAVEKAGLWFEEDFRQLSEEAPSEGLTTIPERGQQT